MATRREKLLRLALVVLSLLLCLVAGELFLRLFYPCPFLGYEYIPPYEKFFQYDSRLGWRGRPNASGQFASQDFSVSVSLDQNGYRNTNPPFVEGKKNILILGDSYGWGWGVGDDDMFTEFAMKEEKRLNLYNLSAPGYGTDQEYLALKEFLQGKDDLQYDGLILLFFINDFWDVGATERYSYPKPKFVSDDGKLTLSNVPVPQVKREKFDGSRANNNERLKKSFLRYSHLYNIAKECSVSYTRSTTMYVSSPEPTRWDEEAMKTLLLLLKEIESVCQSKSISFQIVVLLPTYTHPEAWQWERLYDYFEKENVKFTRFKSSRIPRSELWMDRHYSKYGHKLLARHILTVIELDE